MPGAVLEAAIDRGILFGRLDKEVEQHRVDPVRFTLGEETGWKDAGGVSLAGGWRWAINMSNVCLGGVRIESSFGMRGAGIRTRGTDLEA